MRARVAIVGLACAASGLAAACVAAGAPAESGGALASAASCVATGPKYSAHGVSSNEYRLGLNGVPCAFATKWMRKLAARKIVEGIPTKIAGPAGWKCTGFRVAPGWPLRAYLGKCS